jgi:hypothetical protein
MRRALSAAAAALLLLAATAPGEPTPADALDAIKKVGREGEGNEAAAAAWKRLAAAGPDALPAILAAMDGASPAAANWLRTAADAVGEKALRAGKPLPVKELEAFVADTKHAAAARRLAYEWLARADKTAPDRLLPGLLHDPGAELRRDAVAAVLKQAADALAKGDKDAAKAAYRKALTGACDEDQVEDIAKALDDLGAPVDLAAHYGFLREWRLAAPFDNTGEAGFKAVYPPEKGVDVFAVYKGKGGAEAAWKEHVTKDPHGVVDLNKVLGKQKGVAAYAYTAVDSPAERPVEVRAGSNNAVKIFLNGREVYARDEYHHGMQIDQHAGAGVLKAGRNEILLKVCQNEQTENWAQEWKFQVRLCDAAGAAVPWTPGKIDDKAKP